MTEVGGADVAVVISTGYVVGAVVWVGTVHVDDAVHAVVGYPVAVLETRLPLVENVPVFASDKGPVVNVVAEVVTCHPAPDPVASTTV
jgi:hypothetical protein